MTALGPWVGHFVILLQLFASYHTPIHDTGYGCRVFTTDTDTRHLRKYNSSSTMMSKALRPASRRILSARPIVATAVPARWQHNNSGPFDPVPGHEMGVGELEGAKFRIEPLRRVGEDPETMRARLTCTCGPAVAALDTYPHGGGALFRPHKYFYTCFADLLITPGKQTSPASAAPSSPTSSSAPSPPPTCRA